MAAPGEGRTKGTKGAAAEAGTADESTQNAPPPQSEKAATEETEREHKPPPLSTRINTHKVSPRHKLILTHYLPRRSAEPARQWAQGRRAMRRKYASSGQAPPKGEGEPCASKRASRRRRAREMRAGEQAAEGVRAIARAED